jgi:hypothetical protein
MQKLAAAAAALLLTGCVSIQSTKLARLPPEVARAPVTLSDARPAKDDVAPRAYEVEGKSTFFTQSGGGSVAAGALFGAIGAAVNSVVVDAKTESMGEAVAASGLYAVDALEEARAALGKLPPPRAGAVSLSVQPYAVLFVADEAVGVETAATLRVTRAVEGEAKVVGGYTLYLDGALPLASLEKPLGPAQIAAHKEGLRRAFAELYRELLSDLEGKAPAKQELAKVKARALGTIAFPWNVARNAAGHRVLRRLVGWGDTYAAVVFAADTQYEFTEGPVPREEEPPAEAPAPAAPPTQVSDART